MLLADEITENPALAFLIEACALFYRASESEIIT
jgi:hypothetical protein